MKKTMKFLYIGLFISTILLGCSKLDRENYDKIKVGMYYQEVVSIIGEPDKCDSALGVKKCIWGNEEKNITVNFVANKVAIPSMKGL